MNIYKKTPIIVVCGATASGKSQLGIDIARKFGGEIVNADSMQVYKGMDIATAMPSASEMAEVPHHLFAILEPEQSFSVVQWIELAKTKIAEIESRGAIPVIVGGTGLYISSLIDDVTFSETKVNPEFRQKMYKFAQNHGNEALHAKLREVDFEAYSRLHMNNTKRIIRALELANKNVSEKSPEFVQNTSEHSPLKPVMFTIEFEERQMLYDRINVRVDGMIANGLIEEARKFVFKKNQINCEFCTAAQAIGHKEFLPYFNGIAELDSCIETLKMKTRNYAKRQLTWFRKNEQIHRLFVNENTKYVHIFQKASVVLESEFFSQKTKKN
ncbi:MAG: tRNA (adenosine(37)-N6)-dimethylallyltransferase MiaA [Oscillospiraceae bacterium]|nr:tRNA (adenosine(37)-N6)-dimethylallyltransferase MiaA [Oscillospiraceae bacterium]